MASKYGCYFKFLEFVRLVRLTIVYYKQSISAQSPGIY
jgi:hypothetical protein